jgi:hypothetical protein
MDRKGAVLGVMVNLLSQKREPPPSLLRDVTPPDPANSVLHSPAPMNHGLVQLVRESGELVGSVAQSHAVVNLPKERGHEFRGHPQLSCVTRIDHLTQALDRCAFQLESMRNGGGEIVDGAPASMNAGFGAVSGVQELSAFLKPWPVSFLHRGQELPRVPAHRLGIRCGISHELLR